MVHIDASSHYTHNGIPNKCVHSSKAATSQNSWAYSVIYVFGACTVNLVTITCYNFNLLWCDDMDMVYPVAHKALCSGTKFRHISISVGYLLHNWILFSRAGLWYIIGIKSFSIYVQQSSSKLNCVATWVSTLSVFGLFITALGSCQLKKVAVQQLLLHQRYNCIHGN